MARPARLPLKRTENNDRGVSQCISHQDRDSVASSGPSRHHRKYIPRSSGCSCCHTVRGNGTNRRIANADCQFPMRRAQQKRHKMLREPIGPTPGPPPPCGCKKFCADLVTNIRANVEGRQSPTSRSCSRHPCKPVRRVRARCRRFGESSFKHAVGEGSHHERGEILRCASALRADQPNQCRQHRGISPFTTRNPAKPR